MFGCLGAGQLIVEGHHRAFGGVNAARAKNDMLASFAHPEEHRPVHAGENRGIQVHGGPLCIEFQDPV